MRGFPRPAGEPISGTILGDYYLPRPLSRCYHGAVMSYAMVIGAGGQIGSDLVPRLFRQGFRLLLVDRVAPSDRIRQMLDQSLPGQPWDSWWRVLDVTDHSAIQDLIAEQQPSVVFHLAALLSARCEGSPAECWDVNMAGFRNVLSALASLTEEPEPTQQPVSRPQLIWPSSIAAFGPPCGDVTSYSADDDGPLRPVTMYGVTKVAGEVLGAYAAARMGVDFRSLRFPGLLNTAEPGGGSSDYANAMYFAAGRRQTRATSFVGPTRRIPFMHMSDAVTALIQLAMADESKLSRRTYNIRGFEAPSAEEIAASLANEVEGFEVEYVPDHRQDIVDSWPEDFDDTAARRDWGWRPEVDSLDKLTRRLLQEIRALP